MPFREGSIAVETTSAEDFRLLERLHYEGNQELFEVPEGFETDFASVPRAFWWLIPRYGKYTRAAILHDHLCEQADKGEFDRADADGIFRRSMRELDVPFLWRWVMWAAVRFGSGPRNLLARPGEALLATAWGLAALVVLLVPALVVTAWLAFTGLLEWVVGVVLYLLPGGHAVKLPWPADADWCPIESESEAS